MSKGYWLGVDIGTYSSKGVIVAEAGRVSRRTVQERVSRRDVLLLLALLAFLAEIVYRKLSEMRRRGRSGA